MSDESHERKGQLEAPDIPGHQIFEEIGQGGMGLVYRAQQESPSREVALKIVAPYSLRAEEARQRFLVEVEAMAAIEHPAVLPLYQSGEDDYGRPWLTMQLVRGGSLDENLPSYLGNWRESIRLLQRLCEAIAYAHEHGLLHRDLKPANILFDEKGNPYVADFGLAKWAEADGGISQTSYLLGSPAYLAPEAAEGGSKLTTTSSDVYGLGAILYELLTGHRPYEGESANEVLTKIISGSPPPPRRIAAKVPRDLEVIVLKAMSRHPQARYHSAKAFGEDLQRWMDGRPILARPVSTAGQIWLWTKRNPALAALSVLLLLSLAVGSTLLTIKNRALSLALDDAEQRVDFMVRDLPAQVAPLGRLEVLDSVFEDVAKHYQNAPRQDAANLARHADFQNQWGQILRPRALTDDSLVKLRKAHQLAQEACRKSKGPLTLPVLRARVSAGWRLGEVLIEDENFAEASAVLTETNDFLKTHRNRFPDDLRLAHLEAGLSLERVILFTKTEQAERALQLSTTTEKLWERFQTLLETSPPGAETDSFRVEVARVPFFINLIHRELENSDERERTITAYVAATRDLVTKDEGNLTFVSEHFTAQLVRGVFYLDRERGNPDEIVADLTAADQRSQKIYAQDPGNVKWGSNSVYLAVTLARIAKKRGDEAEFDRWLTIVDERLHRLYDLPITEIDSLRARCNAGLYCIDQHNGRDWNWVRAHHLETHLLQIAICRQTGKVNSFHWLRRMIRSFVDALQENEGEAGAIAWLTEFNEVLEEERLTVAPTSSQARWWHLVEGFLWGQRDRMGEVGARTEASRSLLQAVAEAGQLLAHEKLRPPNRLELLTNLITASGDRTLGQTAATDTALAQIFLTTIPRLTEDEQTSAFNILKANHQQSDGTFREGYQSLQSLNPESE